jgi:prephenate dehydratase
MPNKWIAMTNFAFALPNRPGELARITATLRQAGINLLGLWGYAEGEERPHVSCVPESPEQFRRFAAQQKLECEEGHALYMIGDDKPGALHEALEKIAQAKINVEAIECVAAGNRFGCFLWASDSDWSALTRTLGAS